MASCPCCLPLERYCSTPDREWPVGKVFALLPTFGYFEHGRSATWVMFVDLSVLNSPAEAEGAAMFWIGGDSILEADIRVALGPTKIDADEFLAALARQG